MLAITDKDDVLDVLFGGLDDPRRDRLKKYPVEEIFFLALIGVICGASSWRMISLIGEARLALLRNYFPYKNGIPSHQTIGRVFSLIKPGAFETTFGQFMQRIQGSTQGDIVAIDGKTVRGSGHNGSRPLHLLNVWAVKNGLTLAQRAVDEKTNEITVIPKVLADLNIQGAIVTVDALNCQKSIAEAVLVGGGDYVMTVKRNHPALFNRIDDHFHKSELSQSIHGFFETNEKAHGRIERRYCYSVNASKLGVEMTTEWPGIRSFGILVSEVQRKGKISSEVRYVISSLNSNAQRLAETARAHWNIENNLHWVLDVTFDEDASTIRKDHAPRNFATIRKLAHNLMNLHTTDKTTLPKKRVKALMSPDYLADILSCGGFK